MNCHPSWGLFPNSTPASYQELAHRFDFLPKLNQSLGNNILPRGLGRSYGDSCLNNDGLLLSSRLLNHFIAFDPQVGILKCEAGLSLEQILNFAVPRGWFLPITPGTKFVTVGGAIANDVHGKNHHRAGNWGHHILSFELLRSNGDRLICSKNQNQDYFTATIGGLGLTGMITWAEVQLKKISSTLIDQEQLQFHSLQDFFKLSAESENNFEYTVAWVDCLGPNERLNGIFIRGNHSNNKTHELTLHKSGNLKQIPCFFPEWALNPLSIRLFNETYYRKNLRSFKANTSHYDPFFYPLDTLHHWNRIYGKRGFLQYQCVVPFKDDGGAALTEILRLIKKSNMGSFLAVLKTFGAIPSRGILSFPCEGVTLALDFPNYGKELLKVLESCDAVVRSAGGRVYPAKDARMSKESFESFYPRIEEFKKYLDPKMSSTFWRRIT